MIDVRVSRHSHIPVYRQIVVQVTFMVEMGQLVDGQRLPGSRMLADNLGINRNTVTHAYGELRALGIVEPRGRNGMVVVGAEAARAGFVARDRARELLADAVRASLELGETPASVHALVAGLTASEGRGAGADHGARTADATVRVAFAECNAERADAFAGELATRLGVPVRPLVLGEPQPHGEAHDLVLTTFFHLAEVRAALRGAATEVVAIVAAPHLQTLMEVAKVPRGRTVGIWYASDVQAHGIRDSLAQAGVTSIRVLHDGSDDELDGVDVVVVPTEQPALRDRLAGRVRVVPFGNVLDEASVRMAQEVLRELQTGRPPST